nr:unnamed protein product [Spirometra erinaceieuropaei]
MMSEKEVRIRELEQALRESVRLTAEREAHVASREDSTRQLEQQIRELRSNVEHLQRERNNLSAQLASQQEELRDRESQLKNLESDCFQGYIPELEKLRRANQDANLKIAALIKLVHGHEEHLTEQDRSVLATIPMFPGFATKGALGGKLQTRPWGPTSGSVPNVGLLAPGIGGTGGGASGTAYLGTGASTGGATSPHFAGSAFQLIGSNSAAATAAALSAGGISMPMQTADSVLLGRLLHEKETMVSWAGPTCSFRFVEQDSESVVLQQQLQDLTRLRFQNSEMEVKMKALQRDLENKNTRLNALESSQTADIVTGLGDWQTPMSRIQVAQAELTTLRQSNAELREKLAQAQTTLQERENELQRLQLSQTSAATLEIERLKLELAKIKEEREAMERNLRMEVNQLTDDMNRSNSAAVNAEAELQDKKDKIRLLEFEQVKATTEASALQKKYQTVLGQLTERTDKLQLLEKECQQNHTQEIQRLKSENEDLNHRVTYLHRNNQEREAKLEQQETELSKQKDELSNVKKQAHCLEAELKSLREEIAYKDERSRQLQVQHADELARMRSVHQEQSSRLSHLQLALDEKDHELNTLNGDLDKYRSELEHTKNRLKETETERNQNSAELVQRTDRCRALELECQGQADELVRIQSNLEDAKSKSNILQKRVEEREQRLRKIEGENHGLLDEIHGLRKSNHELESHIDVLRQRLLDRDERSPSTVPILPGFSQSGPGISPSVEKASLQLTAEVDRLKKQNIELEASNNKTKQALQDLQIKMDQLDYERSNLSRSYEEEREKRTLLEKELHGRDAKMQTPISTGPAGDEGRAHGRTDFAANTTVEKGAEVTRMRQWSPTERPKAISSQKAGFSTNFLLLQAESTAQANAQVEQLTLTVSQLKRDIERRDSQIQQLNQQIVQAEKLSKMSTATGSERDVLLNELKISLQRTQQALDEANEQNHLLQARTETTMLETQQQFLIQQQSLQQQIANLQQSLHEAGMNSDRLQKEVRQSSTRIQDLTRQLRETQANCDSIASQRDSLQSRIEQSKRSKFETEKLKKQQQDLTNQIANLQKQVTAKDNLIEQLTSQLKTAQEKCTDTERRLAEAAKRLDSLDSQFNQLTQKLNQAIKESTDQTQVIQELSRQLEAAKASTQQAERDVDSARRQAAAWANEQVQQQQLRLQSEQAQRGQEAAEALKAALEARDRAQQAAAALETELTNQREAMEAQAEIIRTSEERCKTSHFQEIERLNKETQELRRALDAASNNVKSAGADESLKQEIDFLKKEVSKRDAALGKLEKDCQEKHVRKLEVLQVQLKRYEEEAANLNRVLDEQRNGMEERDRLIRQLKSENVSSQFFSQGFVARTIEALTASLAEKNANIALIETSGSTNASTQQAVSKLQTERDQLQKQLRQLSFARDALAEQRKMR